MSSSSKPIVFRFFCAVDDYTVPLLIANIDKKLQQGMDKFTILISSKGGSVFHGISAYNYLKGIPAEITTHNFGSINSSASVIYCAGDKRYSVPHGNFLMHPVRSTFPKGAYLTQDDMEEKIKGMKLDSENIAGVISSATGKTEAEILDLMKKRTNLNPEEAKDFGFVQEIKEVLFEPNSEIINISDRPHAPAPGTIKKSDKK